MKRNFISSIANELDLDDRREFSKGLENEQVETKLNTLGWLKANWGSLLVGVVLAVAVAALWVVLQALVAWAVNNNEFKATSVLLGPQAGNLAVQLPKGAARALSARVDEYEPPVAGSSSVLDMRMTVRAVFGGEAPAASELSELDSAELTTGIIEKWLALEPTAAEACTLLPSAPVTPAAARHYSETLSTDDRTALWLALRAAGAPDGALRAVGLVGLGVAAVEDVRERVEGAVRERDRADATRQLIDNAKPAVDVENEVKKAASELAGALILRRTAGDYRTAAELVIWVGGAGHGYTLPMRGEFNGAPEAHRRSLPQTVSQRLIGLNLLSSPSKKKRRSLFGGA